MWWRRPGNGRERREVLDVGQVPGKLVGHPLDQEVAEADAGQTLLTVVDRIEDRRVGLLGVVRLGARVEQALHVARHAVHQRHLDEDQRLVGHARMEEGEAAAVRIEAVLEVAPRADGVHRLVGHQLLEQRRRGAPVDAHQIEEADVEPGAEQRTQILAQHARRGVGAAQGHQLGPQVDHELHALRHADEFMQQADGGRFERLAQGARRLLGRAPALDDRHRRLARQAVIVGERQQKFLAAGRRQREVGLTQLGGTAAPRGLAALALQAGSRSGS